MIHPYEGGGLPMAPKADPCDGKLSVCLVHGMSRLRTMILLPTIMLGKHILFRGVERFECGQLKSNLKNAPVLADGKHQPYPHISKPVLFQNKYE